MVQNSKENSASLLDKFLAQANSVIIDKDHEIRLTACCLLAGGHLLLEDIPGVGKTTLVKMLAQSLGLRFSRIQFTKNFQKGVLAVSYGCGTKCGWDYLVFIRKENKKWIVEEVKVTSMS